MPLSAVLINLLGVLLLVLGKDQLLAPVVLAATLHVGKFAIGTAMYWLGDAVDISALIVLEVLLEVQSHVARRVGRATYPGKCGLSALGAKLLVHLSRHVEAAVAAQHPGFELFDA